jgi:hypothetical protein
VADREFSLFRPALLTKAEIEWLSDKRLRKPISKSYKYKMKSTVRNKLQVFAKAELPLLLKSGLFPELADSQFFGGCKFSDYDSGLGKAKVPGPNPGQGLPIFRKGDQFEL